MRLPVRHLTDLTAALSVEKRVSARLDESAKRARLGWAGELSSRLSILLTVQVVLVDIGSH